MARIDTNIAIQGFKNHPKAITILDGNEIVFSFITSIELLSHPLLTANEETLINEFIKGCIVIDNTPSLQRAVIKIRKEFNLKIPDAFIAATALHFNLPFFSADKNFQRIPDLNFIHVEF